MPPTRHGRLCSLRPICNLRPGSRKDSLKPWLLHLGTDPSPLAQDDNRLMALSTGATFVVESFLHRLEKQSGGKSFKKQVG